MAVIRQMGAADLPYVVNLAYDMHAECPHYTALGPVVAEAVTEYLGAFTEPGLRVAWVADEDGEIVGFNGLVFQPLFFSGEPEAHQTGLYVTPAHRGGVIAENLITAMVDAAEAIGAKQLVMGVTSGVRHERTVTLLARSGFEQHGELMRRTF